MRELLHPPALLAVAQRLVVVDPLGCDPQDDRQHHEHREWRSYEKQVENHRVRHRPPGR